MDELKKNSVLIVDDEELNIMALTDILSPIYTVLAVRDGYSAIEAADAYLPDVILLDIVMPDIDGYAVITALKSAAKTKDTPVIFISGLSDPGDEEKGLTLGAADYISKPFNPAIVRLRVNNQIKMLNQLRTIESLSMMDQLTSMPNRRGFDNRIALEWIRAMREGVPISLLIIDVDKFKVYNDTYGHQQGDIVLRVVAATLMQSLNRASDFAARWGGEEFVALLPNTDADSALLIAERIRLNINNETIPCVNGAETGVTVSIGVNTQTPKRNGLYDTFIAEADKALYIAKEAGRNRVCHFDDNISKQIDLTATPHFDGLVLVCEDNLTNQYFICEHLERAGLRYITAENGKIGLETVMDRMEKGLKPFDIILMDIFMPVMDGAQAAAKITGLNTGTPIIAMTASIMADELESYKASGMCEYVGKPFEARELWRVLYKYLTPDARSGGTRSVQPAPVSVSAADKDKQTADDGLMRQKLRAHFLKSNRNKHTEITEAIKAGDITLAHRLTHTLKSNAGLIGKTGLQNAAAEAEKSLRSGHMPTPEQLEKLKSEFNAAVRELEPPIDEPVN